MLIINTFPTHPENLKLTEIIIWVASLINYKKLGYQLKLFCEKKDFKFLKKYYLYELYDEIDTELFRKNAVLKHINIEVFWAARKFEALDYQINYLNENCIYSDTDIIMRSKLDTSKEVLVWSPEDWKEIEKNVYLPWEYLSVPENYKMPEYIKNTNDAYNCGILYFKNKFVFNRWYKEFFSFAINNPCMLFKHDNHLNNIFICNAEQRVLKAVLNEFKQDVTFVMDHKGKGWSEKGSHYFFFKRSWENLDKQKMPVKEFVIGMLNCTIKECLDIIHSVSDECYEFWLKKFYLKSSEDINIEKQIFPIEEYY